jgi:DNA-binding CsgD family transcriptional regulator/tetratricopeptide (TPR) repeat protein
VLSPGHRRLLGLLISRNIHRAMRDGGASLDRHARLRGRSADCALLADLLEAIRRGESRSLVLRGEPGIGKTALLEHLVESASEMTVLRATGVESEMELAFAGLHQLFLPVQDRFELVPAPQLEALETVFGLRSGTAPDHLLLGLAVLSLLSEVAAEHPLLCVVDDAQWLDRGSALTLGIVARRLVAERIGMVFATREPSEELRPLPTLEVQGLRHEDARALLGSAVTFALDAQVRDQIIAETRGNPLALLELPRGLTEPQLAGGFRMTDAKMLPIRIEESYVRRVESLSGDAGQLLLLAAAEPVGDPLLLWRAGERLGLDPTAADELEEHQLLTIGDRVVFRHPLVRSAVYASAEAPRRRAAHRALAEATDKDADPDRRAWHLAAATAGPDEAVAVELERSAGRAQARGGFAAAAAFRERALAVTADPARRPGRALAAAESLVQAGLFDAARRLVSTAEAGALDELQRTQVELLQGQIALFSTLTGDALPLLMTAAQHLERVDASLARDTYLDAWGAALLAGRLSTSGGLLEVSRAARSAPRPDGPPRPSDLLLDSLATLMTDGREAATPLLEEATRTFVEEGTIEASRRWGWLTVVPTYALWDEKSAYAISARQLDAVRHAGALALLTLELATFDLLSVRCGDFASAEGAIAEADALSKATGIGMASTGAMRLAAFRGTEDAEALIKSARRDASAAGQGVVVELTEWLLAVLYNGVGRYEDAIAAANIAGDNLRGEVFVSAWTAMELLEAATRTDNAEVANLALERVVESTAFARTDSAQGILARSHALVSEGSAAERLYQEAIERLNRSLLRPELARAHLLYGEWLRRAGRRADGRAQLRAAYDQLSSIGMEAFAERARRELLATGEKVRKRTSETRGDLTVQERRIAELARSGLSNPEIGTRLFLSPRTVEWHLHHVFAKLGIRSRRELREALSGS